jgi:hypothetical protein
MCVLDQKLHKATCFPIRLALGEADFEGSTFLPRSIQRQNLGRMCNQLGICSLPFLMHFLKPDRCRLLGFGL